MSYEGYEQVLCKNGHLEQIPAPWWSNEYKCHCGEGVMFTNSVDDTNCDSYGIILEEGWKSLLIEEEKTETCSHCNHTKLVSHARYRKPTARDLKRIRMRREVTDNGDNVWVNIEEYRRTQEIVES